MLYQPLKTSNFHFIGFQQMFPVVCWHNTGDQSFTQRIDWKHFGFLKGTYDIKDIWKDKVIGTTSKNLEVNIESHDVLFLKLTPAK